MQNLKKFWPLIVGAFLVVVIGVGSGWIIFAKVINKSAGGAVGAAPGVKSTSTEAGALDPKVKYDNATGTLVEGGANNEGTHHLDRDGIPAHYVYLTSSVIDLQSFVGKKVEVWGQTLASRKVGWLMDVAKIQVQ